MPRMVERLARPPTGTGELLLRTDARVGRSVSLRCAGSGRTIREIFEPVPLLLGHLAAGGQLVGAVGPDVVERRVQQDEERHGQHADQRAVHEQPGRLAVAERRR